MGTWVGSSPQADAIKMTVDANGNVTTVVSFKMIANRLGQRPIRQERSKQQAISIYYWDSEGLDGADALLPGITGLECR